MARAVPGRLGDVEVDFTAHVRAGCRAQLHDSPLVTINGHALAVEMHYLPLTRAHVSEGGREAGNVDGNVCVERAK